MPCAIDKVHCENCGSTDPEDINLHENDGYSTCCNELIKLDSADCRDHHGARRGLT